MNDLSYLCSIDKISTFRSSVPQVIAVFIKNLVLFCYGLGSGYTTVLIAGLINSPEFDVGRDEVAWIASLSLAFIPIGCLLSGVLSQKFGRKRIILLSNIPLFVAWLLTRFSNELWQILFAQCIVGFSYGLTESPVISYVAEISTPNLRGALSSTATLSGMMGILTQFILSTVYDWRQCALVSAIFPIIALNLMFVIPESPRWLLANNRPDKAKQSLAWLRGWVTIAAVEKEFKCLEKELSQSTSTDLSDTKSAFCKVSFWKPFGLITFALFIEQFSGITNLQTYAIELFHTFQAPIDKYYANLILGIINVLGTLLCVVLIYYTGKRILIFLSLLMSALFAVIIATYAYEHGILAMNLDSEDIAVSSNTTYVTEERYSVLMSHWIPTCCLFCFDFFYHVGVRVIPWILVCEVYSFQTRAVAIGLSAGVNYLFAFVVNKIFFVMVDLLTLSGMFFFYAMVLIVGFVVLYFIMPETEGKTLAEIAEHYDGGKQLTNKVSKKKDISGPDDLWYVNLDITDSLYYNLDSGDIDQFE